MAAGQVVAYDLASGSVAWRRDQPSLPLSTPAWAGERLLVLSDSAGMIFLVDPAGGRVMREVSSKSDLAAPPMAATVIGDTAFVLSGDSLAAVSSTRDGSQWVDAISPDQRTLLGHFVGVRHIAVLASDRGPGNNANPAGLPVADRVFVLERDSGRLVGVYRLDPSLAGLDIAACRLTEAGLLLATPNDTVVIPVAD